MCRGLIPLARRRLAAKARVTELRDSITAVVTEAERLERILAVWDGPVAKTSSPRKTSSATGTRAGRGARPAQFMDAVTDSPGITANDIASEMECNINYVYRLAKDLSDRVEKRGKGFYPVGHVEVEGDEGTDEAVEATVAEERPVAAKIDGRAVARMYALISEKPGISVPALARETGFTTMWIYRLIWDMKNAGLVRREKDGRTWRYTVTGAVKENAHVDA